MCAYVIYSIDRSYTRNKLNYSRSYLWKQSLLGVILDYYYHDFEPDVVNTLNYLKNVSEPMTKRFTLGLLQALDGSPI